MPQLFFRENTAVRAAAADITKIDRARRASGPNVFAAFGKLAARGWIFKIRRYPRNSSQFYIPQTFFGHDDRTHETFGIRVERIKHDFFGSYPSPRSVLRT